MITFLPRFVKNRPLEKGRLAFYERPSQMFYLQVTT